MTVQQAIAVAVEIQNPQEYTDLPSENMIQEWCEIALQQKLDASCDVLIRIIDEAESAELNQNYRNKSGPTNVLSFVNELPEFMSEIAELNVPQKHLGDLVICQPLVVHEAQQQGKTILSHWAHLVVHGLLHLTGYDHLDESEAEEMEGYEIQILEQLGFTNPYV